MGKATTLTAALERAASVPETGVRILDRREKGTWLGWDEILERAGRVAAGLRAIGVEAGYTVGLIYPTGEEFFAAFFGVLLAGAVPAPMYPPVRLGRLKEYQARTAKMLRAAMGDDVGQLPLSAQFAVGNVEELSRSMDLAQCVPGLDVGGLVVAIARIDLVMDRHGPVVGDAQAG